MNTSYFEYILNIKIYLGKKWPSRPHGGRARLISCLMGIISNAWKHRTMDSCSYVDGVIWAEARLYKDSQKSGQESSKNWVEKTEDMNVCGGYRLV